MLRRSLTGTASAWMTPSRITCASIAGSVTGAASSRGDIPGSATSRGLALSARPSERPERRGGGRWRGDARTAWTHPILTKSAEERSRSLQNRIADAITEFAGSMPFVYLHIVWFAAWIGFGVESYPFGLLTMIVSLEAIFLSTFVMISQNRADAEARGARGAPVADRPGRGEAERGAPQHLPADPGAHEGDPFDHEGLERGILLA